MIKVMQDQHAELVRPFLGEEVWAVIKGLNGGGASESESCPVILYREF